ncbi:unnamed protein product [Triticum turgidum subsp. durum]|uniref:Uncharacterized protein n=1 Tax=Triticum turgidum subsp. durum TaxID=4567 RepID=A0A9R0Q3T2_TRITD|nr:unnamed protein product [Triticum turgidum subsp. durum]
MAQQQQPDAPPLGFFERISTCDVSLRKRQQRDSAAMASSDPALPPPLLLLPPPVPEQALVPPPARANPRPTVLDGVLSLLRSGESFIRGAFRGNSRRASPPGPPTSQQQQQPPQQQHHRNHPGEIMKRLQRETFPDVMRLMDKHEQIDRILSMCRSGKGFHFPELPVRAKVVLDAVGALLLVDDEEFDQAREILGEAGNRTGLNSRFVLESKTRGSDTIAAEFSTRLGIGASVREEDTERRPLELTRLQYCAHVNHWLSIILVPFGAQCNGFLHGRSLIQQNLRSQASLDGPPSFSEQHNCAAGFSMRGSNFTVSLAELVFGSGAQDGDHGVANRMTTFGQVRYEPAQDVKLSLSGLWQIRPLLSRLNNLGTLAIPFGSLKPQRSTPPDILLAPMPRTDPASQGPGPRPAQSIAAAMVECELFEAMRAQGWVEMEGWCGRGPVRWGCCLSDTPEHELGWGVRMGGTAEGDTHCPHLEGFLSFNLGRGGKLQPGLVYVMEGEKRTPALVLRSTWFM